MISYGAAALLAVCGTLRFASSLATRSSMARHKKFKNGIMMILSPAKTLDLSPMSKILSGQLEPTEPDCDRDCTGQVVKAMKKRNGGDLKKLLKLSAKLAETAAGYWADFALDRNGDATLKPCIYAFSGAAYQGLQIHKCEEKSVAYMQDFLRIVDPVYGLLRPLDRIQPYRLEMATRGVLDDKKIKLADFWSDSVTKRLSKELENCSDPVLLNLASDEYSAAVDSSCLPENARFIKVVFWENGRVVSVHAKRARGLMVRYIAESQACSVDKVKEFSEEGYSFQDAKSDETTFVFDRPKQQPAKRPAPSTPRTTKPKKKIK